MTLIGYHRKEAIRLLHHGYRLQYLDCRRQHRQYTPEMKAALAILEARDQIYSNRLAPLPSEDKQ